MMKLEANIFPKFIHGPESLTDLKRMLAGLPDLERSLIESPLGQFPVVTLALTEFNNGMEYSTGVLESYQFVITRRHSLHGEWHVGGANGEILNVSTFISGFRDFLVRKIAEWDDSQS